MQGYNKGNRLSRLQIQRLDFRLQLSRRHRSFIDCRYFSQNVSDRLEGNDAELPSNVLHFLAQACVIVLSSCTISLCGWSREAGRSCFLCLCVVCVKISTTS